MQRYLVAIVYRDQGDEGTPTFSDPQIVWGVTSKSACKAGRYPNSTDNEGRLWGAPEALAIVGPDGKLSYLSHYDYRMVDETYGKAIDYTKEAETGLDLMKFINAKAYFEAYRALCRMRIDYASLQQDRAWAPVDWKPHEWCKKRADFWGRSYEYWKMKLEESFKQEKEYLNGVSSPD